MKKHISLLPFIFLTFGILHMSGTSLTAGMAAGDASLSDLIVNGRTIIGFHGDTLEYRVALPDSVIEVPAIIAVASDTAAELFIYPADTLPGTTTIEVTSGDSARIYTVDFYNAENIYFDFESGENPFLDFSGGYVSIIDNPHPAGIDTSVKVGKMIKNPGDVWAGSYIELVDSIDFSVSKIFTLKVMTPRAGVDVMLKLEHLTRQRINREVHAITTVANEWEELSFDFSEISGKWPIHKIVLIFEMGTVGKGGEEFTYYFDDIKQLYNYDLCLAKAGDDMAVVDDDRDGKEQVTLDASASIGTPSVVGYQWLDGGTLISEEANPTVELSTGPHYIALRITDDNGNTSQDAMVLDVREVVWQENFDSLDLNIWNYNLGDGCDQGPNLCGWGNFELEYYQEENVSVVPIEGEEGNSALLIEAKKESVANSQFTSGKITTEGNLAVKYGILEVRLKAPDVETGLWPAAWLLGVNYRTAGWPVCGEIDLMEMGQTFAFRDENGFPESTGNDLVGANLLWYTEEACGEDNPTCAASIAYDHHYCTPYYTENLLNERYVIYRTYWKESEIRLTVFDEGVEHDFYTGPFPVTDSEDAFRKPFYFVLNLAVGGLFTGITNPGEITAPMPARMMVDYVRVLKWNGTGNVYYGYILANAGEDQELTDSNNDGIETVTLDGSESKYPNGTIRSYSWTKYNSEIATGVNPTVDLPVGEHTITLTVTGDDGAISSDEVRISIEEGPADIQENSSSVFSIYPNPVHDVLWISAGNERVERVRLYSVGGVLILEAKDCDRINLGSFPAGLYMVEVESEGRSIRKKIVVL